MANYCRAVTKSLRGTSLLYIERDPHSRTEIGGRDILAVHKNEAMVA